MSYYIKRVAGNAGYAKFDSLHRSYAKVCGQGVLGVTADGISYCNDAILLVVHLNHCFKRRNYVLVYVRDAGYRCYEDPKYL